jgi:hypothetical protein
MRDAKELYYSNIKELTQEEILVLGDYDLNWCDCCGRVDSTYDLIWIGEDFQLKKGEKCSKKFYEKWGDNALCLECYEKEIKKGGIWTWIKMRILSILK